MLVYYSALIAAWIGAWLLHESIGLGSQAPIADTLFWTAAKVLIWLLPIALTSTALLRWPLAALLALKDVRSGALTGVKIGALFVAVSFLKDLFTRDFGLPTAEPGLLNALLIAPVFEEILFRGFFLGVLLEGGIGFWTANIVVAVLFLGMHLPGWYFMASPSLTQGAAMLGILLVGLGAGLARARSGSFCGSIAFHVVNNLYSAFLR